MDVTQIPGLAGWPGVLLTLFAMIVYGWYTNKSIKSKVEDIAKQANKDAIAAMQTHLNILKERMEEAEKDNERMKHELQAIYLALKARGIYVSVDRNMVHVQDSRGSSTTIHISDITPEEKLS